MLDGKPAADAVIDSLVAAKAGCGGLDCIVAGSFLFGRRGGRFGFAGRSGCKCHGHAEKGQGDGEKSAHRP